MEVGQHGKNYIMTNFPIQKKKLKLAMLGMTEGNGHPYSWSIIINGKYNAQALAKCPYAAIIDYMAIQPKLGTTGSHISAIITGGTENSRIERLESILNTHLSGWKSHLIADLKQKKIVVGYSNCVDYDIFSNQRILLAGPRYL